jgi:hypothetical protein
VSVAIRTIKTTLKFFENPPIQDAYLIPKRLQDVHPYISQVKKSYPKEFVVMRVIVIAPLGDMPAWMFRNLAEICLYLDCYIMGYNHLKPGDMNPVKALMVVGEEEQCGLVHYYISYMISSVTKFTDAFRGGCRREAKSVRKDIRKYGEGKKMVDVRTAVSKYQHDLGEIIRKKLKELLEELRNEDKIAFYNGIQHRSYINKFLTQKYGNEWKTKVLNTGSSSGKRQ